MLDIKYPNELLKARTGKETILYKLAGNVQLKLVEVPGVRLIIAILNRKILKTFVDTTINGNLR